MSQSASLSDPDHLMSLARQGDEPARGALFERYRPYLQLLARMQLGRELQEKADTGDLVQETFLEAHRNFSNFRGESEKSFLAWLKTILARRMSALMRRYFGAQGRDIRREKRLEIGLDRTSRQLDRGLLAPGSSPSHQAARREQGVLLARMLAELPGDYREVIILRHLQDMTFPEIAEHLQRSVDSVQKVWVRALAALRQLMGELQ